MGKKRGPKGVTKAKAALKAKAKRLASKTAAPKIMTDKAVKEAKAALLLRGHKADMEPRPKAKGDMVSGKTGKRQRQGRGKGQRQGQGHQAPRRSQGQGHLIS